LAGISTKKENDTMFAALVRFIQEWKRYNQSLNELSRLGDRELADIGISRSDIARVAWNCPSRLSSTSRSTEHARDSSRAFRFLQG
jgi:uncharacterized protein YjiS (DUF1127 family)